ncbi:CotH kinase family protein [Brevibacterium sp. VCM10]|uniref:CotH kinase family protein n=1 Tax=Brevibacterium sp. VCM10 TaxID=1381751 RepID=UPI000470B090|nr:CotH kinase family protein [Brevibacterium sp. VCM10]
MSEEQRDPVPNEQSPVDHPTAEATAPDRPKKRRLRHRLPVRLRHYWKTAAAVAAGFVAVVLLFGGYTVRPYITSQLVSEEVVSNDIAGEGNLFDGKSHSIEITFDQSEYEDMMATFQDEGEKEYIKADMTIDGTLIEDVGLRLKGNSTLMSLRGDSGMPGGGGADAPQMPDGQGGDRQARQGDAEQADDRQDATGQADDRQGGGMGMVQLSEDSPEELPWLVSFDEYDDGRAYQGHTEIALRPAASGSDTALNEALALSLTAESGQTTQDYSFTSVSVNGSDSAARLVLDAPDAQWADEYGNGVLYKGRAGGSFDYLGEDPTDYDDAFKQINADGSYDMQPVMNLLDFVNNSDDEEFAEELHEHVDVESFATYLATQELLSNGDAMDGPGNNYYLWYDTEEDKFTVLSWDLNMSLSSMGGVGGMPGSGGDTAESDSADGGQQAAQAGEGMPEGGPGGGQGAGPGAGPGGAGSDGAQGDGDGEKGGGSRGSGVLKERFLDNEDFHKLYEEAYSELYSSLIEDGSVNATLEQIAKQATAAGDEDTDSAVASLRKALSEISAEAPEESTSMLDNGGPPGQ